MLRGLCTNRPLGEPACGSSIPVPAVRLGAPLARRLLMVWQTPVATDIRFGFEITLYVAAR